MLDLERQRNKQISENETSALAGVDSPHLDSGNIWWEKDPISRTVDLSSDVKSQLDRTDESGPTTRQLLGFVVRRKLSIIGHTNRDGRC